MRVLALILSAPAIVAAGVVYCVAWCAATVMAAIGNWTMPRPDRGEE